MTAVLNAANEAANEKFRENVGLGFLDIPKLIEGVMEMHKEEVKVEGVELEDILAMDAWARKSVEKEIVKVLKGDKMFV